MPFPNEELFESVRRWVADHYPGHPAMTVSLEIGHGLKAILAIPPAAPVPLAVPLVIGPQPAPEGSRPTHSPDFRSATVKGVEYFFTPTQAAVVRVLWGAHEDGSQDVGQVALVEVTGSDNEDRRLRDVFKSNNQLNPAWGAFIVPGETKGSYRLNLE